MVFESLADKLQQTFKKLRGRGKLSESDVSEALREVRMALLEADVNFKVAKEFVARVKERAVGQEVLGSLTPAQHVIKIVNDELTELLGGTQSRITISSRPPTVIMLVGLQGAGKTTTAGKLANLLRKQNKKPLLVAGDIYRPAAIKQLQVLGEQLDLPVFTLGDKESPVTIAEKAIQHANAYARDVVIIDTAGRLHINEELMDELKSIKKTVKPHEILLVVDAMTGQDAVNVAESFNEALGIDGVILTKLDGDARGGAALSIKSVTGRPIKFAGMGEKLDALETFHPDRMASRILGMGDVLSLIEKAQTSINLEQAQEMEKKLRKDSFTLDDFLDQLQQVRKLGPLDQILGMLPGMGNLKKLQGMEFDEKELKRVEAVIQSMTKKERRDPSIINGSRRKRIASGSGTKVQDVNRLLKQFVEARKMMKKFQEMQKSGKKPGGFKLPFMR
ncbi:signal recognition particle subunit FFH/SRP54 (srp54) [Anaerospora hongkongensis]|uniref:Signal recognition particle protein n=1 Tax=Anaerospora hongkongensis TaxID=244830 RepID=A0A4R1Q318_9FIRM|nr:signal recognition particle protein [Anaerospora hongkongensis]TCL40217.1 signal recognition particle subunit FFH/SRP54 (srp54) [Anaerospora hongkongensis]